MEDGEFEFELEYEDFKNFELESEEVDEETSIEVNELSDIICNYLHEKENSFSILEKSFNKISYYLLCSDIFKREKNVNIE